MFSIFKKFRDSLKKTAQNALGAISGLFAKKIEPQDIDLIEETLYGADFGFDTTERVVDAIKRDYSKN